jgi:hypothetical protein
MTFAFANDAAMGNLNYPRSPLDHYPTPENVTLALLPFLHRHTCGPIWEPACGTGAISDVLASSGFTMRNTDIKDYGISTEIIDFLKSKETAHAIVTNPPFAQAEAFIRQSLALTRERRGMAALLLRHEYDCAAGRVDLFNQPPFAQKIILTFRPRWIADSTGAPRHNYAWFVWNWKWVTAPIISYAGRP